MLGRKVDIFNLTSHHSVHVLNLLRNVLLTASLFLHLYIFPPQSLKSWFLKFFQNVRAIHDNHHWWLSQIKSDLPIFKVLILKLNLSLRPCTQFKIPSFYLILVLVLWILIEASLLLIPFSGELSTIWNHSTALVVSDGTTMRRANCVHV